MKKIIVTCIFALTALFLYSGVAAPSMLPVFRYALENWRPKPYELIIVYKNQLNGEELAVVDWLKNNSLEDLPYSNFTVRTFDMLSNVEAAIPELEDKLNSDTVPFFVLLSPDETGLRRIICKGNLTLETVKTLVDSPVRKKIAERIFAGDSAVWILIESGNPSKDIAARKKLDFGLAQINKMYGLRKSLTKDLQPLSSDIPLSFSSIKISRDDPLEFYTISILLKGASITDLSKPLVIPVFGRGRALEIYSAENLGSEDISNACSFLVEACTEESMEQNPGYDLLMITDWDSGIIDKWLVMLKPVISEESRESTPSKSLIQLFPAGTVAYILIPMILILSLIMNARYFLKSSEKVCVHCHSRGRFKSLNGMGLCNECASVVNTKMDTVGKMIEKNRTLLNSSSNNAESQRLCDLIIKEAKEAMKYEKIGIPFPDTKPAELIEKYTAKLDTLKIEIEAAKVKEALRTAHSALLPFVEIRCINDAIGHITTAEELLRNSGGGTRVIAFINQKGGVGKTTSTINIGAGLVKLNKKVLIIDFDPQANLTDGLGIKEEKLEYSIYDLITKKIDPGKVIIHKDSLSIIPSHMMLTRVEQDYSNIPGRNTVLRDVLKEIKDYDYILIDCPPTLGFMTINALTAANDIYIPFIPEYFAMKGIRKTLELVDYIKKKENENLFMGGLIGTRYNKMLTLHQEVIEKIRQIFGDQLYHIIREDISLSEASSFGQSIFDYQPQSPGAEDYMGFCKKIVEKKHIHVPSRQMNVGSLSN